MSHEQCKQLWLLCCLHHLWFWLVMPNCSVFPTWCSWTFPLSAVDWTSAHTHILNLCQRATGTKLCVKSTVLFPLWPHWHICPVPGCSIQGHRRKQELLCVKTMTWQKQKKAQLYILLTSVWCKHIYGILSSQPGIMGCVTSQAVTK